MDRMKPLLGLMLVVIMVSSAHAAWISYTSNKGKIVKLPDVVQKPQILSPSHRSPHPLESHNVIVVKSVDNTEILPGGTITYTIATTNQGTNSVTDITFIDAIPSYTTFSDAGGFETITYCHDGSGTNFDNDNAQPVSHVKWMLAEISPLGTATFVLKVKVK
ncbi:MAG: hypothetical protein AB1567_11170 [bacterium]